MLDAATRKKSLKEQWEFVETAIQDAERSGVISDERSKMPKGSGAWPKLQIDDILGECIHHNGSPNCSNYALTAGIHVSKHNHITPGRPLPSIVYAIAIPDIPGPARLVSNLLDRKYAQADGVKPGNENTHLIPILVMGDFESKTHKGKGIKSKPSAHQMANLEIVTNWLQHLFSFDDAGLFGHADLGKPECPGDFLMAWLNGKKGKARRIISVIDWQMSLQWWNSGALPKYGADGNFGPETRAWTAAFQRYCGITCTKVMDPFTELHMLKLFREAMPEEV